MPTPTTTTAEPFRMTIDENPTTTTTTDATTAVAVRPQTAVGLVPRTIDEAWRLANMMAKSALVPKDFRAHPEDVLVAIQLGAELGFAPMQALQSIAVINGRPGVWGDGFLGLILASPSYQDHEEYYEVPGRTVGDRMEYDRADTITTEELKLPATRAVCTFWRKNKSLPLTRTFSVDQAKRARLLGKPGPWTEYPERMLALRARGFAGRDMFPDVLRGIRSTEELLDYPETDAPAAAPQPTPRRVSSSPVSPAPVVEATPAPEPEAPPPAPVVPVDITAGLELTVTNVQPVTNADGTKTYYLVSFSNETTAYTWSATLADQARAAQQVGALVDPTTKTTAFTKCPQQLVTLGVK